MNNSTEPKPGSAKTESGKTTQAQADMPQGHNKDFSQKVGSVAARKLRAQQSVTKNVWSGLGMMGLIGWSIVVPTLLGAAIGIWLDKRYPSAQSWTLMLLVAGLCLGCFNAWRWVEKEDKDIHQHGDNDDGD
ncbi:AtpZ/AtpI family protein [Rheinheimera gaetbuli]